MGFNIEATAGTAAFLKENGIRTRILRKVSEGSEDIPTALRQGHIAYVINTSNVADVGQHNDGYLIRTVATDNCITTLTALDTVSVLLVVLDESTICVSTIDA